jgi:hypothetical protein
MGKQGDTFPDGTTVLPHSTARSNAVQSLQMTSGGSDAHARTFTDALLPTIGQFGFPCPQPRRHPAPVGWSSSSCMASQHSKSHPGHMTLNHILRMQFFFSLPYWGLNSRPHAYLEGALPLELSTTPADGFKVLFPLVRITNVSTSTHTFN